MSALNILSAVANICAVVASLISGAFWLLSTKTAIPSLITNYNSWAAFFSVVTSFLLVTANLSQLKSKD
ncbi:MULTISPECIES: hypothetical protein [Enterobacterales]|uniref:hypothetical protein n=1 Tax=Enterobacterales TaxID=91347 RepID=UPI0011153491|nr:MULTISPECIES: hypothetical protein [Enterobacterales]